MLVSQSAAGFYGPRGDERVDERAPAGDDFLAEVVRGLGGGGARAPRSSACAWSSTRTGVVLSPDRRRAREDAAVLQARRRRPVAGGRQYVPWIHLDDVVGAILFALDTEARERPAQRDRARAGDQQGVLARRSAACCTGPAFAPVPASR